MQQNKNKNLNFLGGGDSGNGLNYSRLRMKVLSTPPIYSPLNAKYNEKKPLHRSDP